MFKIVYLPTAEIVPYPADRPKGWFNSEHRARAFMESWVCVYPLTNGNPLKFVRQGDIYNTTMEVPIHLLEVIEE